MKTLILHIGISKTGSSALQVFWARNREPLAARSFDYFAIGDYSMGAAGKISSGNGAHLARCLYPPGAGIYMDALPKHLDQIDRLISASDCETGILSSELFIDATDSGLIGFRTWLEERGIRLVMFYFIRQQIDFIASSYIQVVKRHGYTGSLEQFVDTTLPSIKHIRYSALYARLLSIVGSDQIICKNYTIAKRSPTGLFDAFLQSFGLDWTGLVNVTEQVNPSLAPEEVAIMLAINKFRPRMELSDYIVNNAASVPNPRATDVAEILPTPIRQKIRQYYADDNQRFAQRYFGRDELFPLADTTPDRSAELTAGLSLEAAVDIFGGLMARFDDRIAALESQLKAGRTK